MQVRVVGAVLAASTVLAGGFVAATSAQANAPSRVGVAKTRPAWLGHSRNLGRAAGQSNASFTVYLAPTGGLAALRARVAQLSTPGSSSYREFLSAAEYHAAYDPSAAAVASVENWLRVNKLRVTGVAAHNQYLQVTGTVAAVQAALAVTINRYQHDGRTVQANSDTVTVPASVAAAVLTVSGLDTTPALATPAATTPVPPPASFVNARPCSLYYGQLTAKTEADGVTKLPKFKGKTLPYAVCGYTGPQLRSAYEGDTDLTGAGVTVGVLDAYASPTITSDIKQYSAAHGDGGYAKGQFSQSNAGSFTHTEPNTDATPDGCGASGWFGEQTLDIEVAHAMAPQANIRYYGAKSCYDNDLQTALTRAVNEDKVDLITNSYGEPDENLTGDAIAAFEAIVLQGSMQGISFMFSSGDNGDDLLKTGLKQTDSSGSDPYVTAVGGTSDAIGANGRFLFQTGWGTQKSTLSADGTGWNLVGFTGGAGGGYSTLFNRPDYQNGVVAASAPAGRAVPDVAMTADPTTGFLEGQTQTYPDGSVHYGEYRIGGTSVASPEFAGMTALLLQHAGGRLGFLNPLLYGQARSGAGTFTDIKGAPKDAGNVRPDYLNANDPSGGLVYSVREFDRDSSLPIAPGWDPVTGIGAPNSNWITSVTATH